MNPMGVGVVRPTMDEHKALYRLGMLHRAIVACQAYSVSADIRDELLHAANNVTGINNKTLLRCSR